MDLSDRGEGLVKYLFLTVIAIALFLVIVFVSSEFIMDFYWFSAVGFRQVFMTNLRYQLILLAVGWGSTVACLLFAWSRVKEALGEEIPSAGDWIFKGLSVFVGFGVGWWFRGNYLVILQFVNQATWNVTDPLFGHDLSFYIFSLPFIRTLLIFIGVISGLALLFSLLIYGMGKAGVEGRGRRSMDNLEFSEGREDSEVWSVSKFLSSWTVVLPTAILTAVAAGLVWLGRYSYLWGFDPGSSIPTEASHMAVNYYIPYVWVRVVGVLLIGGLIVYIFRNFEEVIEKVQMGEFTSLRKVVYVLIACLFIFVVIPGGVFGAINNIYVQPNEPGIQQEYLEWTIESTRRAYGLDRIVKEDYPIDPSGLTSQEALESPTVKNARIVDYRPLKQSYDERQRLRAYYDFHDVDVDRYMIGDEKKLTTISPREIDLAEIPITGGEWQSKNLIYTHGFGAVLSPASEVAPDGSPILSVRDVPPVSDWEGLEINDPRIYFGERTDDYALVRADGLDEFDYPAGDANVFYRYEHDRGVNVGNAWKRLIAWLYTGDFQMLVSGYVGEDSSLLLNRNIHDRVEKIAPFLNYDSDAHFFIDDEGGMNYLLHGITHARNYPYSYTGNRAPGYLNDSVKVFVEANTGDVKFYPIERDPIVETYSNIYPDLFEEDEMPEGYRRHMKYPEDLFTTQMEVFQRYHMEDYRNFYQKEDLWEFASELYHGRETRVEPYNILFDVTGKPGFEDREDEFTLVKPFTPRGRRNLIAWVAVGQDGRNYGRKVALTFSKEELIRGPQQAEAIIDQDEFISEWITLRDRTGSQVLRGNLLALPVAGDLLYIEPVYISAEALAYPQLRNVIAVYEDTAAMENSLEAAVRAVLGDEVEPTLPPDDNLAPVELVDVVREYLSLQEEYNRLIREGKFGEAGSVMDEMMKVADEMERLIG